MRYKFCQQLKNSIFLGHDSLIHCCTCDQDRSPTFFHYYKGERINWKAVIEEKLRYQQEAKKGNIPFSACEKCHFFKESDWDEGGYINEITVSHWTSCNCNCFYCFTAKNKEFFNTREKYALMPLLRDMKEAGILRFDGIVRFLGGDVAMLEEFDEFIRFFLDGGTRHFYIPTSGIRFLPLAAEVLRKGAGEVIVSPDSGNAALYKKIKRVDAYKTVRENMKNYAAAAKIGNTVFRSKYIVIPFVNDTKENVDEWLEECISLGIHYVADDLEENFINQYSQTIPPHIPELMEYMHSKAEELGLKIDRFRYAFQLFYELEQGTAKLAKDKSSYDNQKKYVESLLKR